MLRAVISEIHPVSLFFLVSLPINRISVPYRAEFNLLPV
jgi:hypothetical protein